MFKRIIGAKTFSVHIWNDMKNIFLRQENISCFLFADFIIFLIWNSLRGLLYSRLLEELYLIHMAVIC